MASSLDATTERKRRRLEKRGTECGNQDQVPGTSLGSNLVVYPKFWLQELPDSQDPTEPSEPPISNGEVWTKEEKATLLVTQKLDQLQRTSMKPPSVRDAIRSALKHDTSTRRTMNKNIKAKMGKKNVAPRRKYYPKTNVPAATSDHPKGPANIAQTFQWADKFLNRIFGTFGRDQVMSKLGKWQWDCTTAFSGVGCAETALMSLQAAVDAKEDKGPGRKHIRILWAVEKDPACQKVLASTYGCCCFGDILDLASDLTQKEMYCTTHEKMCPCTVPKRARRDRVQAAGAPCQPYSKMGLQMGEKDEKYQVHEAYYDQAPSNAEIALLENVTEYDIKKQVEKCLGAEWDCYAKCVDPRLWGHGCARPRAYGIAWKRDSKSIDVNFPFDAVLDSLLANPVMTATDYFWMELPPSKLSDAEDRNLNDYLDTTMYKSNWEVCDLNQLVRNGRGRSECADGSLPTLTTNSSRLYAKVHSRSLHPLEMLATQCLPVTKRQSKLSRSPMLEVSGTCNTSLVRMAGNGMSVPTMGAFILAAVLGLK